MRNNPERLAWRILVASFLVFLLLCGGIAYSTYWYIFRSSMSMHVDLTAARGTVRMTLPNTQEAFAITDRRNDLTGELSVRTDTSQGTLTFKDPITSKPIASVVLFDDSFMNITEATAPRYRLNNSGYEIQMLAELGRSEVLVFDAGNRAVTLEINTPHATIHINGEGEYSLNVTDVRTRVTAMDSVARVVDRTNQDTIHIETGQRTVVDRIAGDLPIFEAEESLVTNESLSQHYEIGWNFYNDGVPAGIAETKVIDGRTAVEFDRSQSNWPNLDLGHGETGLRQPIDVDVSEFTSLEIRGTFFIAEQELSACGEQGSECPLMIRIDYVDEQGNTQSHYQGFYAVRDPAIEWPLACSSCRVEHERINLQAWYTFRSGDLLRLLPPDLKPAHIDELRFYASGHAYNVYVSELNLIGSR